MTSFWQDVRYSLRLLGKSPGFTTVALLTLALGIGANTTIFSWINSTLLNPIPGVAHAGELVAVSLGKNVQAPFPLTYPDFVHLREQAQGVSGLAGFSFADAMNLTGNAKPERIWGTVATANYFDVLGVKPILGRGFLPAEDQTPGGAPVAVISYRLWQTRFLGSESVLGQTISINHHPYTVVGVTPPLFQGSQTGLRSDLWIPVMMEQQVLPNGDLIHDHHYFWLLALGRLKPGISLERAQQELTVLMQPMAQQYPEEHKGHEAVTLFPLWRGPFGANAFFSTLLPLLMAISGAVLLLTCANVANLLLVRSVARRREIAIRLSIGASRWRLVRQLLIESLLLSVGGGLVALLVTQWTSGTIMLFVPPTNLPIDLAVRTDRTVLLATLVISILTGVIFGVLPALRTSSINPAAVLKEETATSLGGPGRARLASALVVAQISLSLLLLVCAGLFIRSFVSAQQFNPGFNAEHVLLTSYDLFPAGYTEATGIQFNRQLLGRILALPGVEAATLGSRVPLGFGAASTSVKPEGYVWQPHESMETPEAMVGPDYLHTMQIALAAGRDITMQDTETSQPVAMVNQSFAARYWPNQTALGKHIVTDISDKTFVVVGVTRNTSVANLNADPGPFLYLPVYQLYRPATTIHVRVSGDPLASAAAVEKTIHELNADLPLYNVNTLKSTIQLATVGTRIAGTFVGAFGLLALVLATVGIYGVVSYTTRQRTRELAIRLALGAERGDVFRLVLGQGFRLALMGLSIGLVVSILLTRFLKNLLFGVTSTDALTFSSVAVLLFLVALAACFLPARRATKVDPMAALRYQ
jgi:putative ABC transport system permease protein